MTEKHWIMNEQGCYIIHPNLRYSVFKQRYDLAKKDKGCTIYVNELLSDSYEGPAAQIYLRGIETTLRCLEKCCD